jgi:hypothetical protein
VIREHGSLTRGTIEFEMQEASEQMHSKRQKQLTQQDIEMPS